MGSKIALIEYLNYVNNDGLPIGHGMKVLSEMALLLEGQFETVIISSKAYNTDLNIAEVKRDGIPPICQNRLSINSINKNVFNNLRKALVLAKDCDVIWFTNTDWHLMAYLPFAQKTKKIIATVYRDIRKDVGQSQSRLAFIKRQLVERGLARINLFVATNMNLKLGQSQVFIPDYILGDNYKKYFSDQKISRILCVGAMRKSKDLMGVINHFRGTNIQVYLVGSFQDKDWLMQLEERCTSNIVIEDRMIPYDEYYKLIAESRFTILPYDMNVYETATSGILQEAIFLGSIPIAPEQLLRFNSINGIGYTDLSELPTDCLSLDLMASTVENELDVYEKSVVQERIKESILKLIQ